jgi:arginine decarboxylase
MFLVPKKFYVTSGNTTHEESKLNAFDKALMDAGIAHTNILPVTSILPPDVTEIPTPPPIFLPIGSITHCVLARHEGDAGERICAGLGWGKIEVEWDGNKIQHGIIVEHDGSCSEEYIANELKRKFESMAADREAKPLLSSFKTKCESLDIPENKYGCVIVAAVLILDIKT